MILRLFQVKSVIDVGCGVGTWLAEFARNGVRDYVGIDGGYVPRDLLRIPLTQFFSMNLVRFAPPERKFDLACSLEVAEHLPTSSAEHFVSSLARLAPVTLFSAAIPGQRGTNHVNEQWQSYWAGLFRQHGRVAVDCVRPLVFNDARVELWYRQNVVVYCEPELVPLGLSAATSAYELDRIDPELFRARCASSPRKGLLRKFMSL